ncbi:hypothetical protein PybrP1_001017 [[Pythium] brassicae (nom. inval.)]|nr:hypothetical protein PybrP1_001017 [[Pythium] brassicae (nom. inval.)]
MSVLGKRYAAEISSQMEASLTEYYRQECLRSLYKTQEHSCHHSHSRDLWEYPPRPTKRATVAAPTRHKGVSFALAPEIIGNADPAVDRSPIDVTPISQLELLLLLSQRTFPAAAAQKA